MRKPHPLTILTAVAIVMACAAPRAGAQGHPVHLVQTDCDTLSLDPPRVRVSFSLINLGQTPVCSVRLIPVQAGPILADSCRALECGPAPGWRCRLDGSGGARWEIDPAAPPGYLLYGQKHESFAVILDPLYCCYLVRFDAPDHPAFYEDVVCLECQKPAPPGSAGGAETKP